MSLSPDTVFQIVEVIQKAVEIYQRIQDVPEVIHKLSHRMKWLDTILRNLKHHLRSKAKHALAQLRKTQVDDLLSIVSDTRVDCDRVYVLFDRWAHKVGPLGLQFRDNALGQFAAQAFFALGSSAKELEGLTENIETHRRDIDTYLGLMGVQFAQANHFVLQDMNKKIDAIHEAMTQAKQSAAQSTPRFCNLLSRRTNPKTPRIRAAVRSNFKSLGPSDQVYRPHPRHPDSMSRSY
jgi:DNA anti-recombination protein RmuC